MGINMTSKQLENKIIKIVKNDWEWFEKKEVVKHVKKLLNEHKKNGGNSWHQFNNCKSI